MRQHLEILGINESRIIRISNAMKNILDQLQNEDKFLGIIFTENDLKVVETEDFFDIIMYELINNNLTVIIDRNLFIAARELYDKRYLKTKRHSFFTVLMIYAMFTNAIFDSTIPIYEGGDSENIRAIDDIQKFKIIDNLPIDHLMDLVYGQIDSLSKNELSKAKKIMKPMDKITIEENYNKKLTLFKENYPYMLKCALLLRFPRLSLYRKIKYFFEWMMADYITKSEAIIFALFSFYRNGGVIKNYNTNDYCKLIASIKNATWDVTLISYLKDQAKKNFDRYYLLATIDKKLLEAAKYFLSPDEKRINKLFGNKAVEVQRIINKNNEICRLPGREKLILNRLDTVDKLTTSLENEIKKTTEIKDG